MCRTRARSVVDTATLRVVLIIAIATVVAATTFSDGFYSKPKILIIGPDRIPQNFWSRNMVRGKRQKFNDPFLGVVPTNRGYRQAYGGPWMLFKHPRQKVIGSTKQLPSQTLYARSNADEEAMNKNFGGYTRRSASEKSPAEKEYEAVRRALAQDRVQPMRRSMMPMMGMMSKAGRKRKDKTVKELLPFMIKLADLIDKLDSPNEAKENGGENGMGRTKRRVALLLKGIINGLQKDVEKSVKKLRDQPQIGKGISREYYTRRENVDDSRKLSHSDNRSLIAVVHSKGGTKKEFSSSTELLDEVKEPLQESKKIQKGFQSKRVSDVIKAPLTSTMKIPTIKNANSNDTSGKTEVRTGIDDSGLLVQRETDAVKMIERNTTAPVYSAFDTPSDLVPEYRAFDNIAVEVEGPTEDADISVELVNRAFDDVKPLQRKNILRRTGSVSRY